RAIPTRRSSDLLHIALVGTRPEARGRGLARAVIARTRAAAAEAGYASAELEVDSESLTGATRLYDALGFARDAVYATYEKPVGRLVRGTGDGTGDASSALRRLRVGAGDGRGPRALVPAARGGDRRA